MNNQNLKTNYLTKLFSLCLITLIVLSLGAPSFADEIAIENSNFICELLPDARPTLIKVNSDGSESISSFQQAINSARRKFKRSRRKFQRAKKANNKKKTRRAKRERRNAKFVLNALEACEGGEVPVNPSDIQQIPADVDDQNNDDDQQDDNSSDDLTAGTYAGTLSHSFDGFGCSEEELPDQEVSFIFLFLEDERLVAEDQEGRVLEEEIKGDGTLVVEYFDEEGNEVFLSLTSLPDLTNPPETHTFRMIRQFVNDNCSDVFIGKLKKQ